MRLELHTEIMARLGYRNASPDFVSETTSSHHTEGVLRKVVSAVRPGAEAAEAVLCRQWRWRGGGQAASLVGRQGADRVVLRPPACVPAVLPYK